MTLRLFLVRHGETESNRRGLTLGRSDVPLNDLGREQAGRLASALAHEPLLAVYAGPLQRTVDTAKPDRRRPRPARQHRTRLHRDGRRRSREPHLRGAA